MTTEADRRARRRRWGIALLRATAVGVAFLGLVAFSVVLARITLTPSPASEDLVTSNLRPGRSLRQYAEDYTFLAACKQAGGNLLLGVPFGLLLPVLVPRRLRMVRMVLLTVSVMVVVELIQGALVAGRAFDIDDVILNTSGALLGYVLVGRRISHLYHALGAGEGRSGAGPGTAGPRSGSKSGSKSRTRIRPRPEPNRTTEPKAGPGARPSTSAPTARGRALVDRFRGRRPGRGGRAPGTGRRGS